MYGDWTAKKRLWGREIYRQKLASVVEIIRRNKEAYKLDLPYTTMSDYLCGPWRENKTAPFRYISFWNKALDHFSIICKTLYQKPTSQGTDNCGKPRQSANLKFENLSIGENGPITRSFLTNWSNQW